MGPFGASTALSCYMLVSFSQKYEGGGPFNTGAGGGKADYAFCLVFAMASILLTYPLLCQLSYLPPIFAGDSESLILLTHPLFARIFQQAPPLYTGTLVHFVLYLWSKRNPTTPAIICGYPVPGSMLPFAYLGLKFVIFHGYTDLIHGYLIAHVYYFLEDVVPQVWGRDVLATPQFLINYFGIGEYRPADPIRVIDPQQARGGPAAAAAAAGARAAAAGGGGYNWAGAGRPLGRD